MGARGERVSVYRFHPRGAQVIAAHRWVVRYCGPPYHQVQKFHDGLPTSSSATLLPEASRGGILVLEPTDVDPSEALVDVAMVRKAVPWVSLVVVVPDPEHADPLGKWLTALSRNGARVLPSHPSNPRELASAVGTSLDPWLDLDPWLRTALPGWTASRRVMAVERFEDGFLYDPEEYLLAHPGVRLPSRAPLWTQVGRAVRAALAIQMNCGRAWSAVASEAGFSNLKSMDRALGRSLGVSRSEIMGTVGWEWLLWRVLCERGAGKVRNWDRECPKSWP